MNPDHNHTETTAEFDNLLRFGVQAALATTDFVSACNAYRENLPELAPQYAAMMPPGSARAIAYAMFREIWNHLPRPDQGWKPLTLSKPERNAPCPCGSGQKYKQCCGPLSGTSPFGPSGFSVLAYVLETIPVAQYKNLPFRKLNPEELAHVAEQWLKDGRDAVAAALLEPLLLDVAKLDQRHEYAFDVLCDVYLEQNEPARRVALAERLMQATDRDLKSAAMHRRCTMLADAGDYAAAWTLFKAAQRQDPDNPSLSHLEVVLLASQGEIEQAQNRARFWAARLRKLGYEEEGIVAFMDDIARDPQTLLDMMQGGADADEEDAGFTEVSAEVADALIALVEALPAPSCQHRLSPQDGHAGPLEPEAALAAIEAEWRNVYWRDDEEEDVGQWEETGWIDWLAAHPLAWQSFAVLEDLAGSLEDALFPEEYDEEIDWLEETLLDHAMELLRVNIAANQAEGCTLEWGWHQNRPALRLIAQLAEIAADSDEALPLLEWLLALNPSDNTGHRVALVHHYCAAGRAAEALAVCDERFPGDALSGMRYGRALALYLLGRRDEAAAALAQAKKHSPNIHKTLAAASPRMPAMTPGMVTHGGEDEAWYYRMDWLPLWEKTGALALLLSH
ncbi:MAG: SEC-C domain-containing protein [Rhodocyclaceae bacterium]|nr:SEC-C domain-containing protein [Rhodocyclaceae bacterium]